MEDGQLEAFVLEEPRLRIDVELEPVRARGGVSRRDVAHGVPVAQDDEPTRLVRLFGARVRDELAV